MIEEEPRENVLDRAESPRFRCGGAGVMEPRRCPVRGLVVEEARQN
ncbi:hypothetical protein [Microbacterium halophytorum]|nr:hypothetical protein [Microbacterium halophytorum]